MHLVRRRCSQKMMGTMLGLQSCLDGLGGTFGPPLGGALYDLNNFVPYLISTLCAMSAAGLYDALPAGLAAEHRPLVPERLEVGAQDSTQPLRRVSTFGCPIYQNKRFTSQV